MTSLYVLRQRLREAEAAAAQKPAPKALQRGEYEYRVVCSTGAIYGCGVRISVDRVPNGANGTKPRQQRAAPAIRTAVYRRGV